MNERSYSTLVIDLCHLLFPPSIHCAGADSVLVFSVHDRDKAAADSSCSDEVSLVIPLSLALVATCNFTVCLLCMCGGASSFISCIKLCSAT